MTVITNRSCFNSSKFSKNALINNRENHFICFFFPPRVSLSRVFVSCTFFDHFLWHCFHTVVQKCRCEEEKTTVLEHFFWMFLILWQYFLGVMRSAQQIRVTQNMLPNNGHTLPSNDVVINKESNIPTSRAVQVSHQKIILWERVALCVLYAEFSSQ